MLFCNGKTFSDRIRTTEEFAGKCFCHNRDEWRFWCIRFVEIAPREQWRLHCAKVSGTDAVESHILPLGAARNIDVVVPSAMTHGCDQGLGDRTHSRNHLDMRQQCPLVCHLVFSRQM